MSQARQAADASMCSILKPKFLSYNNAYIIIMCKLRVYTILENVEKFN